MRSFLQVACLVFLTSCSSHPPAPVNGGSFTQAEKRAAESIVQTCIDKQVQEFTVQFSRGRLLDLSEAEIKKILERKVSLCIALAARQDPLLKKRYPPDATPVPGEFLIDPYIPKTKT